MNTITDASPINLTDEAIEQVKHLRSEQDLSAQEYLRIGVKEGGCNGFSYVMGFSEVHENDIKFNIRGTEVVIDKAHIIYLQGMEIDFNTGLSNRGFTFNNPNADETCGCGSSFSTK